MKISLIYIGTTGAGPVYSFEMAKALAESRRCQLQVIVSENVSNLDVWKSYFNNKDVDFHVVKTYNRSKLSVLLNTFNIKRKYKIYKLIRIFNADILYSPFVLMWERFLFGMLHGKVRIVKTIHDVKLHDSYHNIADFFTLLLNYGSMRYVDDVVILNNKDCKKVVNMYHKNTIIIPHACMNYYFSQTSEDKSQTLNYRIGFFGRIEPYKGLDLLVEAFLKLDMQNLKLLIAGSGVIDDSLLKKIKENRNIELINRYIKDEEFQPLLDKVDFVVLPYKSASQSGVIPMCFAYGKTVVATDVGALSEQVPEGTGVLVSVNSDSIAEAIKSLYDSENHINEYGDRARKYAARELTWERSAEILLNALSGK